MFLIGNWGDDFGIIRRVGRLLQERCALLKGRARAYVISVKDFLVANGCYVYRFVVAWSLWEILSSITHWSVMTFMEEVLKIKSTAKPDIFYGIGFFAFITFPTFLIWLLILLWYVIKCNDRLYRRYSFELKIVAFALLLYWCYVSHFDVSNLLIGSMIEVRPYWTPFSIIYNSVQIALYVVALYFWENIWDK